ncbi:hypothetical protein OFC04_25900 [Escherichia coli]|nr:hypothetical protein [Escherichia coli]
MENERKGKYLGRTVQVVPHVIDAIIDTINRVSRVPVDKSGEEPDVCIIELVCWSTVHSSVMASANPQ